MGWLSVEDCTIRNFLDALPFIPTNSGTKLAVYNTSVRNCRYGIDAQGFLGSGQPFVVISDCRLENLGDAIFATGDVSVNLADCVIAHCDTGIHFATTSGITFVASSDCKFSDISNPVVGADAGTFKTAASYGNNAATFSSGYFNQVISLK